MTSARQLAANRANARASTGPKTRAGKARVGRNACRHGLNLPVLADPTLAREIDALAQAIAPQADAERRALASRIAAAQIDLLRVWRARQSLLQGELCGRTAAGRLAAMDRYERRARARRKFAIREFDAAGGKAGAGIFDKTKPMGENPRISEG
jgi:hypothetical protein